jgi:hypothetical protein
VRTTIGVFAIVTLVLLGGYHLMRAAATACTGAACDAYIPLSLLLPVLVLAGAVVTGLLAIASAWRRRAWLIFLLLCAVAGIVGPLVALLVLKDSPDAFVVSSTVLVALVPVSALAYTLSRRRS